MEGSIHRYRQSPVTHANHEETSTNIRPTRSAIIGDLLHEWLTFGNTNPERNQGAKGPLRERPLLSLLARCEGGFAEAPPCHTQERKLHVKASAKRVQDLDKGDIIGGGDLHIGVNDEILVPVCKPTVRILTLTSHVSQHEVFCHWQSEGGFGTERLAVEEKTIRTPVKTPLTNSAPLEMLAP